MSLRVLQLDTGKRKVVKKLYFIHTPDAIPQPKALSVHQIWTPVQQSWHILC